MKRREMLLGMLGAAQLQKAGTSELSVVAKKTGYCPTCGEKAQAWDQDAPCRYRQSMIMMDDNAFVYDPFPGKVVNPDAPPCDKIDMFTGTRDWRRHICHNCKAMYAIPKGLLAKDGSK